MGRISNLVPEPASRSHIGAGRLTAIILLAVIVSASIGGDGCLWTGHSGSGSSIGSSGLNQATSPDPSNGTTNVGASILSWG